MAIITERLEGGVVRTRSDLGLLIERDGMRYSEAVDPAESGRTYTETDEPIEGYTPMRYSTLLIKRELAKLDKWEAAKELLTASGYWDDYVLANYLAENDPVFISAKAAFVQAGILTADELSVLLPKCEWTAD